MLREATFDGGCSEASTFDHCCGLTSLSGLDFGRRRAERRATGGGRGGEEWRRPGCIFSERDSETAPRFWAHVIEIKQKTCLQICTGTNCRALSKYVRVEVRTSFCGYTRLQHTRPTIESTHALVFQPNVSTLHSCFPHHTFAILDPHTHLSWTWWDDGSIDVYRCLIARSQTRWRAARR